MLTPWARTAYHWLLKFGCYSHLLPYHWDDRRKRLRPPGALELTLYYCVFSYCIFIMTFTFGRSIHTFSSRADVFPLMEKLLNIIWVLAYFFDFIIFVQFELHRRDLRIFTNAILATIEEDIPFMMDQAAEKEEKNMRRHLSKQVLISAILLGMNPFVHSTAVPAAPCTPQWFSSLILDCETFKTKHVHVSKIFWVWFQEIWNVTLILYPYSYNWTLIFLGMAWVYRELRDLRRYPEKYEKYRQSQVITYHLNNSVGIYLASFPSLLYGIVALLIYGTIRLWHEDWRANVIFPSCGARCAFESITPLSMAGHANSESKKIVRRIWKRKRGSLFHERFKKSCRVILCQAGSMYTFENTIVPVSFDNLSQMVFTPVTTFQ